MAKKEPDPSNGHAEHTQDADTQQGLGNRPMRPIKLTFLGAGSAFTPRLLNDVLLIPGADRGEIALVDIDRKRLTPMRKIIQMLLARYGKPGWSVSASTRRREVMAGSDYIVNCIEVNGLDCVGFDNEIPLKYGVDQCIGDTIGPGGLFKALRTIPVWIDVLRDAEALCPKALVLNYTNPMNMMCLAAGRTSAMEVVGLCHSVQGTSHQLAARVGIPYPDMQWECAGINHLAWFTRLRHKGRDLYPRLARQARAELYGDPADSDNADPADIGADRVRKDMMLHFGAFITESSGHLSEYLPYYRARRKTLRTYCRKDYEGGSLFYRQGWPKWRAAADEEREAMVQGKTPVVRPRSWEYASWIIEAREKDAPFRIHGNVMNRHRNGGPLIANLAHNGCVEVATMIDHNGLNPCLFGALPPQMAALCQANMNVFELGATAAIEKSKEAAIHALLLDPLTAAVCSPAVIRDMTLELFEAERTFLRGYK